MRPSQRPTGTTRTEASVQWYMVENRGTSCTDPSHLYVQPGGDFSNRVDVAISILRRRQRSRAGLRRIKRTWSVIRLFLLQG